MVTLTTRIALPESVLFRDLGGEAVLLDTRGGMYYGLNEVGTRIWLLLRQGGNLAGVLAALQAEYDASRDSLRSDLLSFIGALLARNLVAAAERDEE